MVRKVTKSQPKKSLRQVKHFSEAIKRQIVKDIENGKCSVLEASRELLVSQQIIYTWVYKYSGYLQKNKVLVVENNSENYQSKLLEKKLREAEAALGRKQIELDFFNKLIELAGADLHIDLKKSFSNLVSNGTVPTKE